MTYQDNFTVNQEVLEEISKNGLDFIPELIRIVVNADWWRTLTILSAVFSSLIYLLSFDGVWANLDQKGLVGILINLALAAAAVWVKQL